MKIALQSWSDMLAIPTIKFQAEGQFCLMKFFAPLLPQLTSPLLSSSPLSSSPQSFSFSPSHLPITDLHSSLFNSPPLHPPFSCAVLTVSLTPELQGLLWEEKDFVKSFMKLELLPETFEQLVSYLTICGIERKRRKLRERRRYIV